MYQINKATGKEVDMEEIVSYKCVVMEEIINTRE
jgi:hypothetical protein